MLCVDEKKDGEPMFCHMSIIPLSMDAEVDYLCMKGKYERKAEKPLSKWMKKRGTRRKKGKPFWHEICPKIYSEEELGSLKFVPIK